MQSIEISLTIKEKCPQLLLGCIESSVEVKKVYPELISLINKEIENLSDSIEVEQINQQPKIRDTRNAYLALGKKPSRYRPSAEALLRRVAMGKGLYEVNNIVDLLNLVSIKTGFSIGGYDVAKIEGDIQLTHGQKEPYQAIGRGELNIEFLPVFRDDKGPFGSPTSDSLRTMVNPVTNRFLLIILAFGGKEGLAEAMELVCQLLGQHASATNIEQKII